MNSSYLYLTILGASLLVPLARSFESKLAFYKSFGALFPAIVIGAIPFLIWDVIFTSIGVWGFNADYTLGYQLLNLPLEEVLFFMVIPYCGVFVYRVLNFYSPNSVFDRIEKHFTNFFMGFSIALALTFFNKTYTLVTFGLLAVAIFIATKGLNISWMGKFYRAYLVLSIPFMIVNGILTGTGIESEVVWYNEEEISGTRVFTIPIEDYFFGMLLMLVVIGLYEFFRKKMHSGESQETSTE